MKPIPRLAVLLLAGCIDYELPQDLPVWPESDPPDLEVVAQEDRIVQVATPVVDVLFTIDNSCSMVDEQALLTENFPKFMDYFSGSGLDYHVGVISTDLDNPAHQGKLRSAAGYPFIDIDTIDPISVFAEMATMGTEGDGVEKGLGATYFALGELRDSFNAGFYRDEASIHTVLISDEADYTEDTIISKREFISWYDGLKRESNHRTFSCIVTMEGTDRGSDYLDVADEIGGISWNITSDRWDDLLDQLGVQASGLKREYYLSQLPVPETIDVEVHEPGGTVLPFDEAVGEPPEGGWVYDRARNSITFVDFMPEPLSEVVIRYTLLSAQQEAQGVTVE